VFRPERSSSLKYELKDDMEIMVVSLGAYMSHKVELVNFFRHLHKGNYENEHKCMWKVQ